MNEPHPQSAGEAASELRSDAERIGGRAADRLHTELDARKDTVASQAQSLSSAIERAGNELNEGNATWLASAFQQGAQQVSRFAEALEKKNSRELVGEVQSFARENPGAFLAACTAVGFAAARIFKAGDPSNRDDQYPMRFSGEAKPTSQTPPTYSPSLPGELA